MQNLAHSQMIRDLMAQSHALREDAEKKDLHAMNADTMRPDVVTKKFNVDNTSANNPHLPNQTKTKPNNPSAPQSKANTDPKTQHVSLSSLECMSDSVLKRFVVRCVRVQVQVQRRGKRISVCVRGLEMKLLASKQVYVWCVDLVNDLIRLKS